MREICTSGSEGGGTQTNESSLPLSVHVTACFPFLGDSKSEGKEFRSYCTGPSRSAQTRPPCSLLEEDLVQPVTPALPPVAHENNLLIVLQQELWVDDFEAQSSADVLIELFGVGAEDNSFPLRLWLKHAPPD